MITFTTALGPRVLGLAVLAASTGGGVGLAFTGGAPPWSWTMLAAVAGASLWVTNANFGDRYSVDDEGIRFENVLLGRVGLPRPRHAPWSAILSAVERDGRTFFLDVEGQRRWVLDRLGGHERFRLVLRSRGVSVAAIETPRPWSRRGDRPGPA